MNIVVVEAVVGWLVGVVRRGKVVSFFFQWEISF